LLTRLGRAVQPQSRRSDSPQTRHVVVMGAIVTMTTSAVKRLFLAGHWLSHLPARALHSAAALAHSSSVTNEDLADVEGDAALLLREARIEDDEPVPVAKLCRSLIGEGPMLTRSGPEACCIRVRERWRVCVRSFVAPARARWLVCHELAEYHYARTGYRGADVEARCDALGAALVVPRRLMLSAMGVHSHRVHSLARSLGVTQALALLRVGEVSGRPVMLERRPGVRLSRGEEFIWAESHPCAHPVKLPDEGRWGWMRRGVG
jgi:hypothetical protein